MTVIHAQVGVPIDHPFPTTAMSHEHDPATHHHHAYEFDMVGTITRQDGGVIDLYDAVGLHEGERADGTIVIALAIDDPVLLGVGTHAFHVRATDRDGLVILDDHGTIIVADGTPAPVREVRPWDLLNPSSDRTTKDVRDARLTVCHSCDRLQVGVCRECLCVVRWKTTLADATCPLGKW